LKCASACKRTASNERANIRLKVCVEVAAVIAISHLTKSFHSNDRGEFIVLNDVSFDVEANEFMCILGPSGCGKSTILNILSGLDAPTSGESRLFGTTRSQPSIGYVFQEPRLLAWRSVSDNIRLVLQHLPISEREKSRRIEEALEQVNLTEFARAYPYQLSGGMQARVAIARALATDPDFLLMDEPFSSLDEITARSMRKLLLQLWEHKKKTILFVTHNIFEATFLADRLVLMSARPGQIYKLLVNDLPRPRDYEDPAVFAASAKIAKDFLTHVVSPE
jgi:NitT/TauT family transport system ATP-binding protein